MLRRFRTLLRSAPGSLRTVLWLSCLAGAFLATHLPPPRTPLRHVPSDKLLHAIGFAVLGMLTIWQAAGGRTGLSRPVLATRYLALLAYALFDEVTQPLVGRSFEWKDWLADAGGAATGMIIAYLLLAGQPVEKTKGEC